MIAHDAGFGNASLDAARKIDLRRYSESLMVS